MRRSGNITQIIKILSQISNKELTLKSISFGSIIRAALDLCAALRGRSKARTTAFEEVAAFDASCRAVTSSSCNRYSPTHEGGSTEEEDARDRVKEKRLELSDLPRRVRFESIFNAY